MRYNTVVSIMASVTYILLSQILGAIAIFAASMAVTTIFHVPSLWCSIILGSAATAYTAMGGLRGVVWADCLQGLLTLAVPILVISKVAYDASNGHVHTQPFDELELRKHFLTVTMDLTTDETLWGMLIAASPTFVNRICLDQMAVQRYLASRTLQEAKSTLVLGTVMTCLFYVLGIGEGMALSSLYRGCDPQMLGNIQKTDQILPYYVQNDFGNLPGFSGIFLAGIVSASISSVSSTVNSQAAVVYMDIVTPYFKVPSERCSCTIKAIAFAAGVVMTGLSLAVPYLGSVLSILFFASAAITGPFVGLLLLGLTAPFATSKTDIRGSVDCTTNSTRFAGQGMEIS
ncbi:sodium-coupled monocarboxylate transporter 1-like [Haemaphysalis longicornis]